MLAYLPSLQVVGRFLEIVLLPLLLIGIAFLADRAGAILPNDTPSLLSANLVADR